MFVKIYLIFKFINEPITYNPTACIEHLQLFVTVVRILEPYTGIKP